MVTHLWFSRPAPSAARPPLQKREIYAIHPLLLSHDLHYCAFVDSMLFILLLAIVALYWYNSMQSKTRAVQFARRECEKQGVQLLDQTVQRIRLSMSRDNGHQWRIWREYRFEYSEDGVNRHEGKLVILGYRLVRSALETSKPVIH